MVLEKIKEWKHSPRKYFEKDCTCGRRLKCTTKYYSTRGGFGMESGLGRCGNFIDLIETFNKNKIKKECPIGLDDSPELCSAGTCLTCQKGGLWKK